MIKLFKKLKPYNLSIIAVMAFVFIQSISELALPTLMADIVDEGIVNGDIQYIIRIGIWMILITAVGTLSGILASYLSSKVGTSFGKSLRNSIFTKVEGFSLYEFDKIGTSSLITRTTNDVTQIQNFIIIALRMIIRAPIMAIGGVILAISKDYQLALILIGVVLFLFLIISIIAKKSMILFQSLQKKLDRLNLVLREYLTGIRVIRAFNRGKVEKIRFNEANQDLTMTSIKVNKLMAILMPLMMLLFNLTIVVIFWVGAIHIDTGIMEVGDLMAFIQYATQIMFSLMMLTMMFIMVPRASVSSERINEVLDLKSEINDPEKPETIRGKRGYIEFKNVTFNYDGAEEAAVKDISFSAKPGEFTAIIGSTGAGKSTLANLMLRFYDVTEGSILIDGLDIRKITQAHLREKIGFVPQNSVLFSGTIADNIRYGKEDATEEEISRAAEISQAMEFISKMKEGFESRISQGGKNISGGQKQRVSIARALIKKPEIYIFDDSFSALDFKTDAKLRQALKKEIVDSTVILVAQRVATVMDADRIIVLEDGHVEGIGTHKELISTCEVYKEIVSSQLSEEEIA